MAHQEAVLDAVRQMQTTAMTALIPCLTKADTDQLLERGHLYGRIAYKAVDSELCGHGGYQYRVGETFTHTGKVQVCFSGLHYSLNPTDCMAYHDGPGRRYLEVMDMNDDPKGFSCERPGCMITKVATRTLKVLREIPRDEWSQLTTGSTIYRLNGFIIIDQFLKGVRHLLSSFPSTMLAGQDGGDFLDATMIIHCNRHLSMLLTKIDEKYSIIGGGMEDIVPRFRIPLLPAFHAACNQVLECHQALQTYDAKWIVKFPPLERCLDVAPHSRATSAASKHDWWAWVLVGSCMAGGLCYAWFRKQQ